ncbi:MAG: hypothetical protein U9P12_03895 [Verrucomicrobiota bacterium]|nr:hypothetical protein [Verrucomicrobiota bacterium]
MKKSTHRATVLLLAHLFLPGLRTVVADNTRYAVEIHAATQSIMAVAWGDFDEHHPGDELGCLMQDGSVMALHPHASGWTSSILFEQNPPLPAPITPKNRTSIGIGDVFPAHAGNEIVISVNRKLIAIYREDASGWTNAIVDDRSLWVGHAWGAEVGDCDPAHIGDEIFYVYEGVFDFSSGDVFSESDGLWAADSAYYAEVGMDAAIGNTNPDHGGNEIVVVTEMGPAYEILPPAGGGTGPWTKRTIWDEYDNAGWVVKIGDIEPDIPGNELAYGTRYSNRIMLSRHNGTNMHPVEVLYTGNATNWNAREMQDIAIGNLVGNSPTAEIVGVDASGSVYLVQKTNTTWRGSTVWQDAAGLYAVAVSDILSAFPGDEIVVAGESGAITLLLDPRVSLDITAKDSQQAVVSWTTATGLVHSVETATNLSLATPWILETNLTCRDAFLGTLFYTNAAGTPSCSFRVKSVVP